MSKREEELFRQLMADFAQERGRALLEQEKDLPPLPEREQLRLLQAARQAQKEAQASAPSRPAARWRRPAAAAALALLAGSAVFFGSAEAVQNSVRRMEIRMTEDGVSFSLPEADWEEDWTMEGQYAPAWLPEGYAPMEQSKNSIEGYDSFGYYQTNYYKNGTILFQRFATYALESIADTEEQESAEPVWVGELEGGLVSKKWYPSTEYRLTWYDPEAKSYFSLHTTDLTREELFAIAESVQRID